MGISKMRAKFIATLPRGGVSHTVLVTDVPGVQVGTVMGHARKVGLPPLFHPASEPALWHHAQP
jgi:hypothetical protein